MVETFVQLFTNTIGTLAGTVALTAVLVATLLTVWSAWLIVRLIANIFVTALALSIFLWIVIGIGVWSIFLTLP